MLRDLIDQQLLLSKGKELNIIPDAEVVRRLDEIRKQNNFRHPGRPGKSRAFAGRLL